MSNGYRYVGNGESYRTVPTRDITQDEYDALPILAQRAVDESGAYEPIVPEKKEAAKPVKKEESNGDS